MRGLPDNNVDGAERTIPYIYLDFCRLFLSSGESGGSRVYSFCTVLSRGIKQIRDHMNSEF